jgi:hypothetical protein
MDAGTGAMGVTQRRFAHCREVSATKIGDANCAADSNHRD